MSGDCTGLLDRESSSTWHNGLVGGRYFSSVNRNNSVSLALARSEGRTGVCLRAGLIF